MGRTHVVLSDDLIEAIDGAVGERGRSRFLEQAAREKLARLALEASLRETAGIAGGGRYGHWRDRQAAAEWVRETRRTEPSI